MTALLRGRAPLLVAGVMTVAAAAVYPSEHHQFSGHPSFLPAVLSLVLFFDLLALSLLVQQFRDTGHRRSLVMATAYLWSLVTMAGYAFAFPKVIASDPPFATAPSVAPYLYIAWHTGFPLLLGLAWAPWPERFARDTAPADRRRTAVRATLGSLAVSVGAVTLVVTQGPHLPVLISGLDTSRMTHLTAPLSLPLVLLAVWWTVRALPTQRGPERWTATAVWVCLLDLLLTYSARQRFSLGWYAGRTLTVLAAGVVVVAMLRATSRATSALRRQEAQQQVILDNLREAVLLQDVDGTVLLANAATAHLLPGLDPGSAVRSVPALERDGTPVAPDDRPSAVVARTLAPVRDRVIGLPSMDGGLSWISVNTTPVFGPDGELVSVVSSYTDVTERETARVLLEAARDAAVAADSAKSSFLAMTSHEIRTPLNGLLGMTGLLLRTDLDDRQRQLATTAKACGEQLLALLNDVLDASKAEAGKLELDLQPTDLHAVLRDATAMVADNAVAKQLALTTTIAAGVPDHVLGDGLRLRQALANLLANAVKFTASGAVSVTVEPVDGLVRFAVQDSGIGIDTATADRLFEPFQQADSSTTRTFGGTGLGLAIVREIATLHGGASGAIGVPGQGSTFWFTAVLPAVDVAPTTGVPEQRAAQLTGRVLLAEDNLVNQQVAGMLLEELGLDYVIVGNGREAVDAAAAGGVDVVLMDCQMPVLDGLDATREIRALGLRLPVVALTAAASTADERDCRAAGMDGYLTKPIDPEALAAVLGAVLPRK